jgi:O-Antigen ligase
MITLLFGLGIGILLTCMLSIFFWAKVQFGWLSKLCTFLVLSLPFEYFPRLELGGASWRISQVLVIVGFWIITILVLKKDSKLLAHKLHFATWYPIIFLTLSSPSWFVMQDLQRFIVHMVGTLFVFGAFILLINFASNVWKNLQRLALVLFGCAVFGLYQFFGDLIGIPTSLTLLREHYTKIIFGVPRVQGTAVEPLYFAGMLLIAIFVLIFWICERVESQRNCNSELVSKSSVMGFYKEFISNQNETPLLRNNLLSRGNFQQFISNQFQSHKLNYLFLILITIFTVFLLTISKGTFGVLAILILPLLVVIFLTFYFFRQYVLNHLLQGLLAVILGSILLFAFVNPLTLLGEIGTNFMETLSGTSASAVERSMFVNEAIVGIKQNPLFGIGMGQYGYYAGNNLGSLNDDGKAIVNNVYLEIWLEQGILVLFFFIFFLIQPILTLLHLVVTRWSPLQPKSLVALSLIFILVGYYIQWTLFSPIFIMPIFICLGLAYNLVLSEDL